MPDETVQLAAVPGPVKAVRRLALVRAFANKNKPFAHGLLASELKKELSRVPWSFASGETLLRYNEPGWLVRKTSKQGVEEIFLPDRLFGSQVLAKEAAIASARSYQAPHRGKIATVERVSPTLSAPPAEVFNRPDYNRFLDIAAGSRQTPVHQAINARASTMYGQMYPHEISAGLASGTFFPQQPLGQNPLISGPLRPEELSLGRRFMTGLFRGPIPPQATAVPSSRLTGIVVDMSALEHPKAGPKRLAATKEMLRELARSSRTMPLHTIGAPKERVMIKPAITEFQPEKGMDFREFENLLRLLGKR